MGTGENSSRTSNRDKVSVDEEKKSVTFKGKPIKDHKTKSSPKQEEEHPEPNYWLRKSNKKVEDKLKKLAEDSAKHSTLGALEEFIFKKNDFLNPTGQSSEVISHTTQVEDNGLSKHHNRRFAKKPEHKTHQTGVHFAENNNEQVDVVNVDSDKNNTVNKSQEVEEIVAYTKRQSSAISRTKSNRASDSKERLNKVKQKERNPPKKKLKGKESQGDSGLKEAALGKRMYSMRKRSDSYDYEAVVNNKKRK